MKKKFHVFGSVFLLALVGVLAGLLMGFVFGGLIGYVTELFSVGDGPNLSVGLFFGMGAGSVIGGVFGGIIGYKK
jgi:MFS family permease